MRAMAKAKPKPLSIQRNLLLAALSGSDLKLLRPHLQSVVMATRHEIEMPNTPITNVFFMETGVASVVAVSSGQRIEVGLVGREGMTGTAIVLGNHRSPHATYVQVAGEGQRISAARLRTAMGASSAIRALFLKYVQAFTIQTAHTAIANGRARLDERLSRWLLMAQDRIGGRDLPLTHEFLALMLGVRRAGVTDTLSVLEGDKIIRAERGKITVLDRKRLEGRARESYGVPEAEYRRLIG
jgi:CRP-like cAMP-binding protein